MNEIVSYAKSILDAGVSESQARAEIAEVFDISGAAAQAVIDAYWEAETVKAKDIAYSAYERMLA